MRPNRNSLIFGLSICAIPAVAQRPDGSISGTVKDPSGAVIPGAAVTITHDQTGAVRTSSTSAAGNYTVPSLLVGTYTVKIEATGFAAYTRTGTVAHFVCRNSSGATSVATSAGGCGGNANVVGYVAANPNARYVQAGQGAIANVGRNTVDSEHFNLWNMSLFNF
jgi:hypothetical protein